MRKMTRSHWSVGMVRNFWDHSSTGEKNRLRLRRLSGEKNGSSNEMKDALVSPTIRTKVPSICLNHGFNLASWFNNRQILTQTTFRRSTSYLFLSDKWWAPQASKIGRRLDCAEGLTDDNFRLFFTWNACDLSSERKHHLFFFMWANMWYFITHYGGDRTQTESYFSEGLFLDMSEWWFRS